MNCKQCNDVIDDPNYVIMNVENAAGVSIDNYIVCLGCFKNIKQIIEECSDNYHVSMSCKCENEEVLMKEIAELTPTAEELEKYSEPPPQSWFEEKW